MESSQKLTTVITSIVEFAKMVPGFLGLPQDDQVILLKEGALMFITPLICNIPTREQFAK